MIFTALSVQICFICLIISTGVCWMCKLWDSNQLYNRKSDNTCCCCRFRSLPPALLSEIMTERQWWFSVSIKRATWSKYCFISTVLPFLNSSFLLCVRRGLLAHFPAAGWLFSNLIIQSTCLLLARPYSLFHYPPPLRLCCSFSPPPFIQYQC